jgi:hypothetical protein
MAGVDPEVAAPYQPRRRGPNKFRPDRSTAKARAALSAVGHSTECVDSPGDVPLAGCPRCDEIAARPPAPQGASSSARLRAERDAALARVVELEADVKRLTGERDAARRVVDGLARAVEREHDCAARWKGLARVLRERLSWWGAIIARLRRRVAEPAAPLVGGVEQMRARAAAECSGVGSPWAPIPDKGRPS